MFATLARIFGAASLFRGLFGRNARRAPRGLAFGLPVGGLPMIAFFAWRNRDMLADLYRRFTGRGGRNLAAHSA